MVPGSIRSIPDVCADCRRPVLQSSEQRWVHWDPRIDQPGAAGYHPAVLSVEAEVHWGWLGMTADPMVTTIRRGGSGLRDAA